MSVAVAVLDRDDWHANTDNLAVVDATARRISAVPRDLWCARLGERGERINAAWARGGAAALRGALAEHGFAVGGVLCLRRGAVERALAGVEVEVPVPRRLEFLYPLAPTRPIEEGARAIVFEPPSERLAGERLHQWLGARRVPRGAGSDLDRIARQIVLLRTLLARPAFEWGRARDDPERFAGADEATLAELARVGPDWRFAIFDAVAARQRDGKQVLVARRLGRALWHARERLRDRLRSR